MGDLCPVLCHRAAGRLRHGRHRLHRAVAADRVGPEQARPGTRAQRSTVRPGRRCRVLRPAGRPLWPQGGAGGVGAGVCRGLPGIGLCARSADPDRAALCHRPGAGGGHAERGDADERVLPRRAPRHADQCHVLRLSAGRGPGRIPGGLDDPAFRLAQRAAPGRRRALAGRGAAGAGAAGVGALHGGPGLYGRPHPQAAGAHRR